MDQNENGEKYYPFYKLIASTYVSLTLRQFLKKYFVIFSRFFWPPVSGLVNKRSTCYMNSIMQAAASSNVLIDYLHKMKSSNPSCKSLINFLDLLQALNQPVQSDMKNRENTEILKQLIQSVGWNKTYQQDAFDLFAALISGIHKELKTCGVTDINNPLMLKLVYKYKDVNLPPNIQNHLGLSVTLCGDYSNKPGVILQYLIDQCLSPMKVEEDNSEEIKIYFYQEPPKLLLLHIQANKWDENKNKLRKSKYYIQYDKEMPLWLDVITDLEGDKIKNLKVVYKLKAVVTHMGNISMGHYVTYRECGSEWYSVNDEQINRVQFDQNIIPYILFYERD